MTTPDATPTAPHSDAQPVSSPEPSGSTREAAQGARVARYAEAIRNRIRAMTGPPVIGTSGGLALGATEFDIARAVMAVADQETAELRAEVERLRTRWSSRVRVDTAEKYRTRAEAAEAEVERLRGSTDRAHQSARRASLRAEAESARLASEQRELAAQVAGLRSVVAKVEALHFAYTLYESCPEYVTGCDDDACTENPHDGEWFHSDQPVGRVCGECNDEDGEPVEFPCPTFAVVASVAPDTATPGEVDEPERDPDVCPLSKRADGKHSFRFDGDDPHIVCHFCDEMRDSLTGRVIRPAATSADDKAGE